MKRVWEYLRTPVLHSGERLIDPLVMLLASIPTLYLRLGLGWTSDWLPLIWGAHVFGAMILSLAFIPDGHAFDIPVTQRRDPA